LSLTLSFTFYLLCIHYVYVCFLVDYNLGLYGELKVPVKLFN
jgi:hypothetical protein